MIELNIDNKDIIIRFKNITKKFGDFNAVSDLNIEIKKGEIVGFLGPNGAGKSTNMKMMAYLLKPTEGEIWIRGNGRLEKLSNHNKDYLLDNIGFLIENPTFYGNVTPRIILKYFAELKGYPKKQLNQRIEEVVEMFGLSKWIDKKIKTFSKGMRQKIGIASAIIHNPDIIVLDEPQTGLDPQARREVRDFILQLKKIGKTIFLSSHLLYEISEVADRIAIINQGKIVAFDTLDNLESKAKKSIINFELLDHPEKNNLNIVLDHLRDILAPFTGVSEKINEVNWINYKEEAKIFQILFNGDPKNQLIILKTLLRHEYKVIEFSVPKAGLLEDLFIDLVTTGSSHPSNSTINENQKQKEILVEV